MNAFTTKPDISKWVHEMRVKVKKVKGGSTRSIQEKGDALATPKKTRQTEKK